MTRKDSQVFSEEEKACAAATKLLTSRDVLTSSQETTVARDAAARKDKSLDDDGMQTTTIREDYKDDMALVDDTEVASTKNIEATLGFNLYLVEDVWAHGTKLLA